MRLARHVRRGTAAVAATLACVLGTPAVAAGQYGPDDTPAGANLPCTPSAEHPNPVVLVHGMGANMAQNWGYMSPRLAADGYCVFALTYGRTETNPAPFDRMGGTQPMQESAKELAAFVDDVLAATGAERVDIVGHSEGSLMPNWYVKFLGGAAKVERYVGLTPLWDGTNVAGAGTLYGLGKDSGMSGQVTRFVAENGCGACPQALSGSDFLAEMNAGGVAVPGIDYTMVMTRYDELVVPYWSGWLEGAHNVVLQRVCPLDPAEHAAVAFDPIVLRIVKNALDPAGAEPVDCTDALAAG